MMPNAFLLMRSLPGDLLVVILCAPLFISRSPKLSVVYVSGTNVAKNSVYRYRLFTGYLIGLMDANTGNNEDGGGVKG